jgi:ABC-type arginine/histidine transport system permease subunit
MLFFVPDATFSQQLVMYSFFIGTPVLLFFFIVFVGIKSAKQNRSSRKCSNCHEFIKEQIKACPKCNQDLTGTVVD